VVASCEDNWWRSRSKSERAHFTRAPFVVRDPAIGGSAYARAIRSPPTQEALKHIVQHCERLGPLLNQLQQDTELTVHSGASRSCHDALNSRDGRFNREAEFKQQGRNFDAQVVIAGTAYTSILILSHDSVSPVRVAVRPDWKVEAPVGPLCVAVGSTLYQK
jgi:hypothetical protein